MEKVTLRGNLLSPPYREVASNGLIGIEDGCISSIEEGASISADAIAGEFYDFSENYILPGLIDAHCHLTLPGDEKSTDPYIAKYVESAPCSHQVLTVARNCRKALEGGLTTLVDLGSRGRIMFEVKEALGGGIIDAPRVLVSGPPLTKPGEHCSYFGGEVTSDEEIIDRVNFLAESGADIVKVIASGGWTPGGTPPWGSSFSEDELRVLVSEAHRHELPVTAHVTSKEAVKNCLGAGLDGLEHATFWVDRSQRSVLNDDLVKKIEEKGVFVDMTIQASYRAVNENVDLLDKEEYRERKTKLDDTFSTFSRLNRYDVKFVAGSDAGFKSNPPGDLTLGLGLLVENGMSTAEALKTATSNAAGALKIGDQTGSIDTGKFGDLLVVEGNPLEDISALKDPIAVFKEGERLI